MKRFLFSLITLILTSCGTDTGNPGFGPGVPTSGTGGGSSFMVQAMCNKLSACYSSSLSFSNCYSGVFAATGMTSAMGLNASTYPTLNAAYTGVANGSFHINQTTLDQCSSAIASLTCGDTLVTTSFATGAPTNFNNAFHLLSASTSCQNTIAP